MLAYQYMRGAAAPAAPRLPSAEIERDELYASTISSDRCSSDEDGAADLAVEASPPEHGAPPGEGGAAGDVDASYFSDYAATQAVARAPFLEQRGHSSGDAPAATDVVEESDADGFCDDAYDAAELRIQAQPSTASASGADPRLSAQGGGLLTLPGSEGRRSGSWVDPLRATSTTFSENGAPPATGHKEPTPPGDVLVGRYGLSNSPSCESETRPERRRRTLPYHAGQPSVHVREATSAPSSHSPPLSPSGSRGAPPSNGAKEHQPHRRSARATSSSRTSTLATVDAVQVLPLADVSMLQNSGEFVKGAKSTISATPSTPPRTTQQRRAARVSVSQEGNEAVVHSPPPRRPPTAPSAGTSAGLGSTAAAIPRTRVVRERPVHGAPLLLQCTGHICTPTRTIRVDDMLTDGEEDEGEATVTACLHTSVYKDVADSASGTPSTSSSSPEVMALEEDDGRGGGATRHSRRDHGALLPRRRARRLVRSGSPLLSLVDPQRPVHVDAATESPSHPQRIVVTSISRSGWGTQGEEEVYEGAGEDAMPDMIDFSVQTEPLDVSQHGESLVLCGYSVEPIVACDGARGQPTARPHRGAALNGGSPASYAAMGAAAPVPESRSLFASPPGAKQTPVREEEGEEEEDSVVENWSRAQREAARLSHSRHREPYGTWSAPSERSRGPHAAAAMYAAHDRVHVAQGVVHASSEEMGAVFDLVESVEETPAPHRGDFAAVPYTTTAPRSGGGGGGVGPLRGEVRRAHASPPPPPPRFNERGSSAPHGVVHRADEHATSQQRHQRLTVHSLLARQLRSPQHGAGPGAARPRHNSTLDSCPPGLFTAPAEDYAEAQEQLRRQRLAAEAERVRFSLALDVCAAVRPHARDLLLMFLLFAEESSSRRRRSHGGALHRRGGTVSPDAAGSSSADTTVWGSESRVSYDTCAEAVNCVLERRGVSWVRATRELCRRVVAWCYYHRHRGDAVDDYAHVAEALTDTADDASTDYATFVSAVMEFADGFPASA
ncbi:hypothetical protein NESM_000758100 [Novymonas esmeraldas]|uniref:Uncharacterized protein n=1 Tax=Novymonas esmeraldas TaxID=1808958 RepID=A0AAW0EY18_9TRYP